jgi:hypothetical protein
MDVYRIMVYDWLPSRAAMTELTLWGASATTLRS